MRKSQVTAISSDSPVSSNTASIYHSQLVLKSKRMNVINQTLEQILMLELNYDQFFKVMHQYLDMDSIMVKIKNNLPMNHDDIRFIEFNFNSSDLKIMILHESRLRYLWRLFDVMMQFNPNFLLEMCQCKSSYFIALNQYRVEEWINKFFTAKTTVVEKFIQFNFNRLVKSNQSVLLLIEYLKESEPAGNKSYIQWIFTDKWALNQLKKNNNMVELYKNIVV